MKLQDKVLLKSSFLINYWMWVTCHVRRNKLFFFFPSPLFFSQINSINRIPKPKPKPEKKPKKNETESSAEDAKDSSTTSEKNNTENNKAAYESDGSVTKDSSSTSEKNNAENDKPASESDGLAKEKIDPQPEVHDELWSNRYIVLGFTTDYPPL